MRGSAAAAEDDGRRAAIRPELGRRWGTGTRAGHRRRRHGAKKRGGAVAGGAAAAVVATTTSSKAMRTRCSTGTADMMMTATVGKS